MIWGKNPHADSPVIYNHRLLIKNDIIMRAVASACYEFEITAEDVVEFEHPDKLFRHEFTRRWMARNPHVFEYEQSRE